MPDPSPRVDPDDHHSNLSSRHPRRPRRLMPPRGRGPGGRMINGALKLVLLMTLWVVIIGGIVLTYFAMTLPDTSQLAVAARRPSVTILAADGSLIASFGDMFGQPLTLKQMSPYLPKAVIATEDRRFYSHFGVDPVGLMRAAFTDLRAGHVVQGGSTITQQLAKIVFLTPERSFGRKIREILLALWLERRFTKNQILEIYLNRVYLGAGTYGVDAAAHRYFRKSAAKLNLFESAVIAGLLKAPTRFNPARDRDAAKGRATQVLDNMVDAGFITAADAAAGAKEGTTLAVAGRSGSRYFADWVADQIRDFAGTTDRDLTVKTTLDPRQQTAAEAAIDGVLSRYGVKDAVSQGALVSMSTDGAVRAMVGGRDYGQSQFNRATQAQRQPGSSFKPFVYLAGLEAGLRPDDRFDDAPIRIGNWQPHNYLNHYQGEVSVAEGLAQSINTVAVQVAERAGIPRVIATANRLGITSDLAPDASIALGTNEVNLLELVSAYAPFANGGAGILPYGITEIRDSDGKLVYRRNGSGPGQVISPGMVGMMNEMLAGVISQGTGKRAAIGRPEAGKTGTTQEYRDAWFIGYTADLVAGVWFGNDDNTPMNKVTGGTLPAAAWHSFMLAATRTMPVRPLPSAPAMSDVPVSASVSATAPAEETPLDRLFGWLGGPGGGGPAGLPPDPRGFADPRAFSGGRYPGPAPSN
ncbi:MAG TPA: PBP1A family penicillin-binding protein [Stellaceae bacterium]|jgi:penicillin-binding protein 1A|nr:PBP1A family penicillin-binding protein [Stellaceae bacterium]